MGDHHGWTYGFYHPPNLTCSVDITEPLLILMDSVKPTRRRRHQQPEETTAVEEVETVKHSKPTQQNAVVLSRELLQMY